MRTLHGLLASLVLLLGAPLVLSAGCGAVGDRARTGCPAGEICNPDTENGLRFYGASLGGSFENSPSPVAIGGHQAIHFEDAVSSTAILPQHHVVSSDASHVTADSTAQRSASLRGIAAGTADVRVLDASERLIDRITVSAAQIARVQVVASEDLVLALAPVDSPAPVVFADGTTQVSLALLSETGVRLVDDEMRITSATPINTPAWDTVEAAFGTADVTFTVEAGGGTFEAVAVHAGAIDDFELATWLLPADAMDAPFVGAGDLVCVVPRSGGARIFGSTQALDFRVDGAAVLADESLPSCIGLPGGLGATTSIVVSFGSVTRTFVLNVDPDRTTPAPLLAVGFDMPTIVPRALGARARLAWGLDVER